MMQLGKIIGKKVVTIRGEVQEKYVEPKYILFDDGKTYIELEEQDYYSYHDCSSMARILNIREDAEMWNMIHEHFPVANMDI